MYFQALRSVFDIMVRLNSPPVTGGRTKKKEAGMATLDQLKELEEWWSPSEAGRELETSGQWITHLAREGQIRGVKTSLGWLVYPEDVRTLAKEKKRKKRAEKKLQERRQLRQKQQLQLTA